MHVIALNNGETVAISSEKEDVLRLIEERFSYDLVGVINDMFYDQSALEEEIDWLEMALSEREKLLKENHIDY